MSLFLALDSGGTKTDYVLADDTRELARVRTGTIKRMRVDAETAEQNLETALAELSAKTGYSMKDVTRTCIGTAGESISLVRDWLQEQFRVKVGGGLLILEDVEIALDAAFPGRAGVLVMAGTGSNVVGRTVAGALVHGGGWGPALADQGSGHRIGHESLRAIFLAEDEERTTSLLPAVLDFWHLPSLERLVEFGNSVPSPDFSTLTGVVCKCAEQGDEIALAVLQQQGEELAYLVRLVIRRLRAASTEKNWTPPIAFTGSILENIPPVRNALMAAVQREFPDADVPEQPVDPIEGALWRARTGDFV
jgi:N-acetylglucosamine kinase-like BadF-type ATPase